MEAFKFRLDKILELRSKKEDEINIIIKMLSVEKEELEYELEALKDKYKNYKDKQFVKDIYIQKIIYKYLETLLKSIQSIEESISKTEDKIENEKIKLMECKKNKKAIEKLKEKRFDEFIVYTNKKEQEELDEYAKNIFLRRKKHNGDML